MFSLVTDALRLLFIIDFLTICSIDSFFFFLFFLVTNQDCNLII